MTDEEIKKIARRLHQLMMAQPTSEDGEGRTVIIHESYGGELSVVDFLIDGKELEDSGVICDDLKGALECIQEGPHDKADLKRWKAAARRQARKAEF